VGEKQNQPFQLSFHPYLKVDFRGSRVTSDSGLLLVRELDERLGLSGLIAENIRDDRRGKNTQLPLPDLLQQSIYKQAVKMTRLSCHRFRSNQVRLALSLLAYNLGKFWRRLALPRGIENW
jgi:predicted ribosome quality control (RQC) complex YloA/Tae2 family protein